METPSQTPQAFSWTGILFSKSGIVRIFATQKRLRRPVSSGSLTAAYIFAVP